MQGDLALPRSNGEPVFAAPWESRAFGIAVALNEGGAYDWGDFQRRLANEIAAAPSDAEGTGYYERWLTSLESLLLDYGMVTQAELDARTAVYESGEIDDD
ncbi:MAG: nitrile hydratase accessory protein [Chloroflexi bacterium]|nr:nitrile hydratase accessory protein [Chloroflexota bacterium]